MLYPGYRCRVSDLINIIDGASIHFSFEIQSSRHPLLASGLHDDFENKDWHCALILCTSEHWSGNSTGLSLTLSVTVSVRGGKLGLMICAIKCTE